MVKCSWLALVLLLGCAKPAMSCNRLWFRDEMEWRRAYQEAKAVGIEVEFKHEEDSGEVFANFCADKAIDSKAAPFIHARIHGEDTQPIHR